MTHPVLRLSGLVRTFPSGNKNRTVLKGVSCDFEEGHVYSIVGPSGSGKTTLLALAGGLDAPTSGSVSFRGRDVADIGLAAYRKKHVATVFQSLNLLGYLTAVQNITTAMQITGVRGVSRRRRAAKLLDLLGVDETDRRRRPARLSGGQQQRVAIARALACDVDVLFADEPTGSLDQDTAAEIIGVFQRLAHEEGKCVVIVTHSPQVAAASDEVLHLKRGKLTRR